jgi:predicted AAA+ superfamily ATPase
MIKRALKQTLLDRWSDKKILIVTGPRQVGKTTLLREICEEQGEFLFLNGDDATTREVLVNFSKRKWQIILGNHKVVFIDEAQRINDIGLGAKILYDELPGIKVILSGSSALDLHSQTKESLTGRKWEYHLYPISWEEWTRHTSYIDAHGDLENRLIFGMYPEVLNNERSKKEVLMELSSSYLYKDLLEFEGIRHPKLLSDLLRALALQLGNEVSYNELAQLLQVDRATVEKYIDLLEKAFVVFKLQAMNNNQRNEIKNSRKIYFYDNGIRNAILQNFSPISLRTDIGALWENFLISERLKKNTYQRNFTQPYFWRNYAGHEIDYIESRDGSLSAFEFKWNPRKKVKIPSGFQKNYPHATFEIIHSNAYDEFLLG